MTSQDRSWDRSSQDRSSRDRSSQDKSSQNRSSQDKSSQDGSSQDRSSQDRSRQDIIPDLNFFRPNVFVIVESKHCPSASDVRALITHPLPTCQTETIMRFFEDDFNSDGDKCTCCYSCIKAHSENGCRKCEDLLGRYLATKTQKLAKPVAKEVREAFEELFATMGIDTLLVEGELAIKTNSFTRDFIQMSDEIKSGDDIVSLWHIDQDIAHNLYLLFHEIVFGNCDTIIDDSDHESESDALDLSSSDSD